MSNKSVDTGIDPLETEVPGPDEIEYPSTLHITALAGETVREATLDRFDQWEQGEEVPHVVNFEEPSQLRALLTDRRIEILEEVMERPPESIRELADRLERDIHDVHDDLHLLAEYGIVYFREKGRAKQPFVPYETVRIEVEIEASGDR